MQKKKAKKKEKKQQQQQEHKINSSVCLSLNRIKRKLEIESEAWFAVEIDCSNSDWLLQEILYIKKNKGSFQILPECLLIQSIVASSTSWNGWFILADSFLSKTNIVKSKLIIRRIMIHSLPNTTVIFWSIRAVVLYASQQHLNLEVSSQNKITFACLNPKTITFACLIPITTWFGSL